jgi:hypothetical protein
MKACVLLLLAAAAAPAYAAPAQDDAVTALAAELKARAPANWQIRVRWRDGELLASVTPWPYQEAFDLWYNSAKLTEALAGLCPKADDEIWRHIKDGQHIVLEPTVGGKSVAEARITCRKANA